MKTALGIIGTLLGIGVVIYIVKMFSKPTAQTSQVKNTNTATALDPFYRLFGLQQTPRSTGQADNTGAYITAGASALSSVSKTFSDLFRRTPAVSGVGSPNVQIGNGLTLAPEPVVTSTPWNDTFDYSIFD